MKEKQEANVIKIFIRAVKGDRFQTGQCYPLNVIIINTGYITESSIVFSFRVKNATLIIVCSRLTGNYHPFLFQRKQTMVCLRRLL